MNSETDLDAAHWDAAQEGAELLREGDIQGSVQELTARLREDADNAYAYFFLGAAHYEGGELSKALKAYLECLERKPRYLGARVALGRTLHALGRHADALRVGRQVLEMAKDDPDGLHLMGVCHYALGDRAAAVRYLERFIETGPELEVAMETRGILEVLQGNAEELPQQDDD